MENRVWKRRAASFLRVVAILALVAALRGEDSPILLTVTGAVKTQLALSADDLAKMPRNTATLDRDGESAAYDGVLLYDILVKAGVRFGRAMTGKPMASYILATSRDGYQVVSCVFDHRA